MAQTKTRGVNRIASRKGLDKLAQTTLLPDPVVEVEVTETVSVRQFIRWTQDERNKVAKKAAEIRLLQVKCPLVKAIAKAQKSVLEKDRWRSENSLNQDEQTFDLVEQFGRQIYNWYQRHHEITRKLEAVDKLNATENELLSILTSGDKLTPLQKTRILEVLQPDDIAKILDINELLTAADPQQLLLACITKGIMGVGEMFSQMQRTSDQLSVVASLLSRQPGVQSKVRQETHDMVYVYGVADATHVSQVKQAAPLNGLDVIGLHDFDNTKIALPCRKVICWKGGGMTKRQVAMVNARVKELKLPADTVAMIMGPIDHVVNAVRNNCSQN